MKRALILYWHGLGDVIMLTPHLRHLYAEGYMIDLMCRAAVRDSKLLDACPYINNLIIVENPWHSKLGFNPQARLNIEQFQSMRKGYDWSGASPHKKPFPKHYKIDITSYELGLEIEDKKLEAFISEEVEQQALSYVDGDFIFYHSIVEFHPWSTWDATEWIKENLPLYKIINTSDLESKFDDINVAFALARRAKHRVLADSVFVHACDAMGCTIDAVNYGRPDRKVWPFDPSIILHIQESGEWIK